MLNKWIGQGRLVRDIETRTAKNDTQIAMFTIACNRDYGDETDFIDCVAFKSTAGFVERNFHKGQMIGIVGRLESSKWEKDGVKRTNWKIVVEQVFFCGESKKSTPDVSSSGFEELADDDGDLPF